MATFPSYADILYEGFSQARESALIRTEMDSGPPRQAKIKSRVMLTRSVSIYLPSKTALADFESWFQNDINYGASWFNFTDPITGSTVQARFVDGGYTITPMSAKLNHWKLTTKIETWSE